MIRILKTIIIPNTAKKAIIIMKNRKDKITTIKIGKIDPMILIAKINKTIKTLKTLKDKIMVTKIAMICKPKITQIIK